MQRLKEQIRTNIIKAAVMEFQEYGYEKASMRAIAKSAGVSVANTYNYFPSKAQLFGAIVEPVFNRMKEIFRRSMQESFKRGLTSNNIQPFVDGIVKELLDMTNRERQLLIILAEKSAGTKYEKSRDEFVNLLRMHLVEAVRKPGSAVVGEDQAYILDIIAANYVDGLFRILKDYRGLPWAEENLRILLTYHLNGIKALS